MQHFVSDCQVFSCLYELVVLILSVFAVNQLITVHFFQFTAVNQCGCLWLYRIVWYFTDWRTYVTVLRGASGLADLGTLGLCWPPWTHTVTLLSLVLQRARRYQSTRSALPCLHWRDLWVVGPAFSTVLSTQWHNTKDMNGQRYEGHSQC